MLGLDFLLYPKQMKAKRRELSVFITFTSHIRINRNRNFIMVIWYGRICCSEDLVLVWSVRAEGDVWKETICSVYIISNLRTFLTLNTYQDDIESRQRQEEILANRIERLRKQKEKRELDTVRFIRSMQMLQCGSHPQATVQPSYDKDGDEGLVEYRKNNIKTMKEKVFDFEMKLSHTHRFVRALYRRLHGVWFIRVITTRNNLLVTRDNGWTLERKLLIKYSDVFFLCLFGRSLCNIFWMGEYLKKKSNLMFYLLICQPC